MRGNNRSGDEWVDELSFENAAYTNTRSFPSSRLRPLPSKQDNEIQRERLRIRILESSLQEVQKSNKQLKQNNIRLRTDVRDIETRSYLMIENHMHAYAKRNGFRFEAFNERSANRLLDQLLDNMMENKDLRQEVNSLRTEAQALRNQLQVAEEAEINKRHWQEHTRELQEQVHRLQQQLLDRVDKECTVSDDKLAMIFHCLAASIKSLSRSIHITRDTKMLEVLGIGGLLIDIDSSHWNTRARKKCLAEAWVWSVLMDRIFASPFALLGEHGGSITELWSQLFRAGHCHGWPAPSALCEKWRYTTMEHSMNALGNDEQDVSMDHDHGASPYSRVRDGTIDIVSARLATISPKGDFAQIPVIVDRAISFALEMSIQRCRLQLTYPSVDATFDKTQMSTIADLDRESIQDRVVAFIVRPGLTKMGRCERPTPQPALRYRHFSCPTSDTQGSHSRACLKVILPR